jgi:uncharacterized membrane protein YcjF (UPF0283 family)
MEPKPMIGQKSTPIAALTETIQQMPQQLAQQQQAPQIPQQRLPQQMPQPQPQKPQKQLQPNYVEQLGSKRKELFKVISYALMILFALALYTAIDFWLKDVIERYDLSFKHELGIKLAYPFLILFLIWNFKIAT